MSGQQQTRTLELARQYFQQQAEAGITEWLFPPCRESQGPPAGLDELYRQFKDCQRCQLWKARTNFVFGAGNPEAEVAFIGEAPGREEDLQGEPFVGRAGQLLTRILEAIHFRREDVYIGNILKCRPPENRDPQPEEVERCLPILEAQLRIIRPRLICALGRIAAQTLLRTSAPLSRLRGRIHELDGVKVIVTYHPAALLRNPNLKRPTWEDVQMLRKEYDRR